jgi:hypothetical protein
MIIVSNWQDSDILDHDVKTCDNKQIGEVKEINQSYLVVRNGDDIIRVPRSAVGTFNDGKIYLRATEAEVLSGMYPFLDSEKVNYQTNSATTASNSPNLPSVPQDV